MREKDGDHPGGWFFCASKIEVCAAQGMQSQENKQRNELSRLLKRVRRRDVMCERGSTGVRVQCKFRRRVLTALDLCAALDGRDGSVVQEVMGRQKGLLGVTVTDGGLAAWKMTVRSGALGWLAGQRCI